MIDLAAVKELLDEKFLEYNTPDYILTDPIQVPHLFIQKENIEIAAFLTATIAWGNRKMIIKNSHQLMQIMDNAPHDFIMNASERDFDILKSFKHRTFNGIDLLYFCKSLRNIYKNHNGLSSVFEKGYLLEESVVSAIAYFREVFFECNHEKRTQKHVANVLKGASCKRINMMLRWLVRKDGRGVDFGIWNNIPVSKLYIPLDLHVGNVARQLGILERKQNDWKAVCELQDILLSFDSEDPCKYDFALFGLGVFK